MRNYKLRTARKHVSPEERKTYIENGTLPSSILTYSYNASGLVTQVKKNNVPLVKFFYNDRNHRLKKETYGGTNGDKISSTHYVRDVGGQVMAIYMEPQNATPKVVEYPVYGSGRIGVYKPGSTPKTLYELTDHLGNVRTVFSVTDTNSGLTNEGYSDYYPFGMPMPNRNVVGDYRYAFQGQEKDTETGKEAFQLRLWDSRIGRWLTTDPAGQYASPYLGMGNNPISRIDSDGGEDNPVYGSDGKRRGSTIEGNDGEAIIFDGDFSGLSVSEVRDRGGFFLGDNSNFANTRAGLDVLNDWFDLPNRADFDNRVTFPEARDNFNGKGIDFFVNLGTLDFKSSTLSVGDFNGVGSNRTVNFLPLINIHKDKPHVLHRPAGSFDLAVVHGTIALRLLDVHGKVGLAVASDVYFDKFDFRTPIFESIIGKGAKQTEFRFFGFGTGQINKTNPFPFKN